VVNKHTKEQGKSCSCI